jgi:predicted nucleic acid-binding protein
VTLYAETSAVLRWLFAEDGGEAIPEALAAAEKVTSSRLALTETRRVVRRAEREWRLTAAQGADLLAVFAQAASTWAILEISEEIACRWRSSSASREPQRRFSRATKVQRTRLLELRVRRGARREAHLVAPGPERLRVRDWRLRRQSWRLDTHCG